MISKHFAASKHGGIHGARRAAAAYEHAVKTRRRRLAPLDDYMRDALRILREAKRSLE